MYVVCPSLDFAVHVITDDASEARALLMPEGRAPRCPQCRRDLSLAPFLDNELLARTQFVMRELTPLETFHAIEELGFPEERDCGEEVVRSVMQQQKVKSVQVKSVRGTGRSVIDSITMEDGTTLFLNGSGWGALVYRIRKPAPYSSREGI